MHTCSMLNKARAPPASSMQELEAAQGLHLQFCNIPGIPYGSVWLAITDAEQEGEWRDYYNGQEVSQEVRGEIIGFGGEREQNCGIVS